MYVVASNANPFWPTGAALGDVKNASPLERFDAGDTRTGASATIPTGSVFQLDSNRKAVIHRIFVASGTATSTIQLVSAQGTSEVLTPAYSAATTGTVYDFSPGFIVQGGFAVVMGTASSTVHIVYSLLEN
jgi:hypothetical protein